MVESTDFQGFCWYTTLHEKTAHVELKKWRFETQIGFYGWQNGRWFRTRVISSREKCPVRGTLLLQVNQKPRYACGIQLDDMVFQVLLPSSSIHPHPHHPSYPSTSTPPKINIAPEKWWLEYYYWWLKSCTTWDVWNPINNGINNLSTG